MPAPGAVRHRRGGPVNPLILRALGILFSAMTAVPATVSSVPAVAEHVHRDECHAKNYPYPVFR
jgi:hypothetical protein